VWYSFQVVLFNPGLAATPSLMESSITTQFKLEYNAGCNKVWI